MTGPVHPDRGDRDREPGEALFTAGPLRWRAPVGRHRGAGRSRLVSVLGGVVLLVAVVAVGGAVSGTRLGVDERYRAFVNTAAAGEPVSARTFEATVLEVRTAAEVSDGPSWGHDTDGVWVLVRVRVEATREPTEVVYAAVRGSRDRVWLPTERVDQSLAGSGARHQLQPGIPVVGDIVFEVPQEVATDLVVRLSSDHDRPAMPTVAEVALPVDEDLVAQGLAEPEPVRLAEPEVVLSEPDQAAGERAAR